MVNSESDFNENLIEKRNINNEPIKTESEKVKKAFRWDFYIFDFSSRTKKR